MQVLPSYRNQSIDQLTFRDKNTGTLLKNVVFFSSDRADLNSILNADIVTKFKELCNWVVFIESVETCVRNLYYLYQKSTRHFMKFCLKCTNLVKIAHSLTVHQEHPELITR